MADFGKIRDHIREMLDAGEDDGAIYDYLKQEGVTKAQVLRNAPMYKDVAKSAVSGAIQGVTAIPKLLAAQQDKNTVPEAFNLRDIKLTRPNVVSQRLNTLLPDWANYDPATNTGKYVKAGTEGMTASLFPGGLAAGAPKLALAASGLLGGITGEGAAQSMPQLPEAARLAGNVVGGQVGMLPRMVAGAGAMARQVQDATSAMGPLAWLRAQQRQNNARAQGIDVTGAEAIGNSAPSLATRQLAVEQDPRTSGAMAALLSRRPQQITGAVNNFLEKVGLAAPDPALLQRRVGGQAEQVIRTAEKARTEAVAPLYDFAKFDALPQKTADSFLKEIAAARVADKTGVFAPQLNYLEGLLTETKAIPGTPAMRTLVQRQGQEKPMYQHTPATAAQPAQALTDPDSLARARRVMRNRVELPPFAAEAVDKETAKVIGNITERLQNALTQYSPAYAAGNELYKQMTPGITALQQGAMGDIAKAPTASAQYDRLIDPAQSTPTTVQDVARGLQRPPPLGAQTVLGGETAYPDLLRHGLSQQYDQALRALAGGAEGFAGARFARGVSATPKTKENILTAIEELPNGKSLSKGFSNLVDALELTGNRLPVGSRTAFNMRTYQDMTSGVMKDALKNPVNLGLKPIFNLWDNWSMQQWQKLLTDPDSVAKLRKLSMMSPSSDAAKTLAGSILGSVRDPTESELVLPQ